MRLDVNIGKCSVTRLVKPASATQKGKLSLAQDRWRFPIRHRKKQETKALAAWNNKRRAAANPKPVAKPLPKSKGIEPFMHLKGKAVNETLSFRVLGTGTTLTSMGGRRSSMQTPWYQTAFGQFGGSGGTLARAMP